MFIALRRPGWYGSVGRLGLFMAALVLALVWHAPVSAQQGSTAGNVVTDIKVGGTDDSPEIIISTTRRPDSSVFTLSSPARLVVDLAETTAGRFTSSIPVNRGPVKEMVVKEFKEAEGTITRVTVYLNEVVEPASEIVENTLHVRLKPRAGGAAAGSGDEEDVIGAEIARMEAGGSGKPERVEQVTLSGGGSVRSEPTSASKSTSGAGSKLLEVYFQPYEKRSRVLIVGAAPLRYTASPVSADHQVIIDIPNTSISKTFQRPLDTSEFPSAIKMISAYPLRNQPDTVRVVVKLREKVDYKVDEQGDRVFFDFPVPASIAGKMPANPVGEPGGTAMTASGQVAMSGEGRQGGVETTKLISSTGQIMDPNAIRTPEGIGSDGLGVIGDSNAPTLYSGRKISIDVREADLHNVFRMIANVSKLNIVSSDNVKGKVTVRLQNVPWDQALAVILQSKGLGAVRYGNIIRIAPLIILKEERQQQLEALKASQNLEPLQTLILPLNFANAPEIRTQVESALSDRGKITVDARTNALIIEDTASGLSKARQLALSLDTQTPQVLIEARVVEVSSSFVREIGIQWGGDVNLGPNSGAPTGLYFPNSAALGGGTSQTGQVITAGAGVPNWVVDLPAASAGALSISLGSISNVINVDARLSALEQVGKGKVISAPKVMTMDNRQAYITQGTRIPYETVSASGTAVQFVEATLRLEVTPHITTDNRVFLRVRVTNNRPDFSNSVNGQPAIEVKEAQTEVMVKDGDTAVLGGVYTLNESENVEGIPGLYRVPFLGWLFKATRDRSDRKELLVFITPHVIARKIQTAG